VAKKDLFSALPALYSEMEVETGKGWGIHRDPESFLKKWLQPYTQHFSYMLSALNMPPKLKHYNGTYSSYVNEVGLNNQIQAQLYCLMCLPTSLWRPAALMAMQKFKVMSSQRSSKDKGKDVEKALGEALLSFLKELECLAVYMEQASKVQENDKLRAYVQASEDILQSTGPYMFAGFHSS
jgi:hypothetical protein